MPLNSFFPTRKRILNFTFLLTLCALTAYFIPSRYQLANLAKPAVLPTVIDNAPTKDKDQPTPTLSAVLGEQNSNQNQSQTDLTDKFIEIKGNLGTLGQLIQKNGKFYLAKNIITNENIQWHTVRDNDLANNSVTSRIIKDHTIQSDDLASNLTMRDLTVNGKLATDKIDLGRNTITDGNLRGNWNLNGGNLTTTGTITANAMNITGATNFTGNATFDGMVTLGSLLPKVAGSLNQTVTAQITALNNGWLADMPQWMVMGQDGFARVVYYTNDSNEVHFIQCQDRDCATKTDTIVASNTNGVDSPIVTVASDGFARITYINYNTPIELHYITCTNADCSVNNDVLVDTSTYKYFYYLSLALDNNNNPYISYDDETAYNDSSLHVMLKLAHCSGGVCSISTLASSDTGSYMEQSVVQIGADGFPRITYVDQTVNPTELHFIQCNVADCSNKTNTIVDTGSYSYIDMKLGSDGLARMVYTDYTNTPDDLRFAQCTNADCTNKNLTTVASPSGLDEVALAFDNHGLARLAYDYFGTLGNYANIGYTMCANDDCSQSSTKLFTDNGYYPPAIAMGQDGLPRIAYETHDKTALKFARLASDSGAPSVTGTSLGSADSPFGSIFGSVINSKELDIQGNSNVPFSIKNLDSSALFSFASNGAVNIQNSAYVSSGRVTQANMKISAVSGSAFVDFSASNALTSYVGKKIVIQDSAGKTIQGYIKAKGTGETYGQELIPGGDFSSSTGWTLTGGSAISNGVCTLTPGSNARRYTVGPKSQYMLLDVSLKINSISGGGVHYFHDGLIINETGPSWSTAGTKSWVHTYIDTSPTRNSYVEAGSGTNAEVDDFSIKQITTPSETGVTIVSTSGGSTYDFASQDSGFNYADSSGYTYQIYDNSDASVFALTRSNVGDLFNVLNSGNVGIGTITPLSKLEVNGVGSFSLGTALLPSYSFTGDLNTGIWSSGPDKINFSTGGHEWMQIDNGGNIGIGTSTPEFKLDVKGNYVQARFSGGGTNGRGLFLGNVVDGYGDYIASDGRYYNSGSWRSKSAYSTGIRFVTGNTYFINDSGLTTEMDFTPTIRMSISSSGNVSIPTGTITVSGVGNSSIAGNLGIGTAVPADLLDVTGNSAVSTIYPIISRNIANTVGPGGNVGIKFALSQGSGNEANKWVSIESFDTTNWGASGGLSFTINQTFTKTKAMVILNTGNVGIGTTAPSEKLEVAGNIRVTGGSFIDDGTTLTVPDYVFEPNYNLKSIPDLETYINQNLHLPNVPSRDQIKKTGMNYGSMIMSILEKTEENTLYTIDNYHQITGLTDKDVSLDDKLNIISQNLTELNAQTKDLASLQKQVNVQTQDFASLQKQMTELQIQAKPIIDFYLALDLKDMLIKDNLGNVTLLDGKITAKDIEALHTITAEDIKATKNLEGDSIKGQSLELSNQVSGTGTIKSGETEVIINSPYATETAKISLTPKGSTSGKNIFVDDIVEGTSFKVKIDNPAAEKDVNFYWFVIK